MAFRCNLAVPAVPAAICDETSWDQTQVVQEGQTQVVQSQRQQPSNFNLVQVSCYILKKFLIEPFPPVSAIPLVKKRAVLDCKAFNGAASQEFAKFMADVFEELLKHGVVDSLFVAKVVKVLALFMGAFKKISCKMSGDKLLDLLRTDEKVLPDPNLASQAYAALTWRKYHNQLHEQFGIAVTYAYLVIYYEVYLPKNLPVVSQPDFGNTKVVVQKMEEAERRYFKFYVLILWRMFPRLPRKDNRLVIQTVLKHCGFSFIENHETIVTTDIQKAIKNKEVKVAEEQKKKDIKKYEGCLKTFFEKPDNIIKLKRAVFDDLNAQKGGMNIRKNGKKDRKKTLSDIAKWFHYVWWKDSSSLELPDINWINDARRPQLVRWFQLNWGKILWTKMLNALCNKMLQSS